MRIFTAYSFNSCLIFLIFAAAGPQLRAEEKTAPSTKADAVSLAVLDTARRAYNEGKFDVSAERFRDFLKQNDKKDEAPG